MQLGNFFFLALSLFKLPKLIQAKDAVEWVYKGEGVVNLILAYTGNSPQFVGKVLRIRKVPRNGAEYENGHSTLSQHEYQVWEEFEGIVLAPTREIAEQLYVQHVICPLLGSAHVDAGIRIPVTREFLEAVENRVLDQCTSRHIDAAKVNPLRDSALLISDHSRFPQGYLTEDSCVTIEIKPKCGFLPNSESIVEANAIKKSTTRFRMHQALKLKQGKISQISKYDPLDLFSQSKDRVRKAIDALSLTPQKNFRVFLNGALIFGGIDAAIDSTQHSVNQTFDDALKHLILAEDGLRTKYFLELIAEASFNSGLLNRILAVQKLDAVDIEGAIHAYYDIVSKPCMVCQRIGESELSGKYSSLHSMPRDESLKIVRNYLISATAKDLSMMISLRSRENVDTDSSYDVVFLEATNQSFDCKVSFIDLDMKLLREMEYYYELDQQIVGCYMQMAKDEKAVGDGEGIE